MKLMKKIIVIVCLVTLTQNTQANRFNPDYAPTLYVFQGQMKINTPFKGLYYKISSLPDFDIPTNKLVRLQPIITDRWSSVNIVNGTKIILSPELSTQGYTDDAKKQIASANPYVLIERENDFITIYLYSQGFGNKLVFNILAFEELMRNTWWYNHLDKKSTHSWDIGIEFYTAQADFTSKEKVTKEQEGPIINMISIELQWANYTYTTAESLYSFIDKKNNVWKVDPQRWHRDLLFQKNVIYKKPLSDDDVSHVEKVLNEAGINLSQSSSTQTTSSSTSQAPTSN